MSEETYPEKCLRGIRSKDMVLEKGTHPATGRVLYGVSRTAFDPDLRTAQERNDGGCETSINWYDDEKAMRQLSRNASAQYGVAILERAHLDYVIDLADNAGALKYERKPEHDNEFHGNIVFSGWTSKPFRAALAGTLAQFSQFVKPS